MALAVSSAKRSALLPNVPTVAEQGYPGFDYTLWVGMIVPAYSEIVIALSVAP